MGRKKISNRVGETKQNYQNNMMTIVSYNNSHDIMVRFQDEHMAMVHTTYQGFNKGSVKNPYSPSVLGVGSIGEKYNPYDIYIDDNGIKVNKVKKEYRVWKHMLERCFDNNYKKKMPSYIDVICSDDWLLFENFYEWLHNQENFDRWLNGEHWCLDKDILHKKNKIYSSENCCLVPTNVNNLFVKNDINRGVLPIGVVKFGDKYRAMCNNKMIGSNTHLGLFESPTDAFNEYKKYKEQLIKQVAQIEFDKQNITKKCYNAMLNYEVEITD